MKERVGQKIKLTNYEALLGVGNEESAVDVSIRDIHSFENHPFKVIDDDKMAELVESIKINGVLTPVLIRPSKKTRGYCLKKHFMQKRIWIQRFMTRQMEKCCRYQRG